MIEFTLNTKPVPCPRPRVTRYGRSYYPKTYTAWKAEATKDLPKNPEFFSDPVRVTISNVIPQFKTKAAAAKNKQPKGDVDNYAKSVLDLITSAKSPIWDDDDQVVELLVTKRFAADGEEPHTEVTIENI